MAVDRESRQLQLYPGPCATCHAKAGEFCITRTGGRLPRRHAGRLGPVQGDG